jgi:DNA-binding transcriptional ArsR family regulator
MANQAKSQSQREYPLGVKAYKKSVERPSAFKKAAEAIRAIDHPLRSQMIDFLESNPNSCVTDIYIKMRLEQSVASQHLKILRDAGLVEADRHGKNFLYRVKERKDLVVALAKSF